jgi:hypothetical protein
MHLYCTLFDRNYITRGLALHDSLLRHRKEFRLLVLCLDETTHGILTDLALPNMELVSLPSLEASDPELMRTRPQRTAVEYYFTCKPVLMKFMAEKYKDARRITYLDSDLFYFSDPGLLEQEYAGGTVALTPHRFPPRLSERKQFGRFNAGWVSASCGEEGKRFIDWWRARCIEWCRMEVQEDRFADQKYLDQVPVLFSQVTILDHVGANLAPWNLDGLDIRRSEGGVAVDGKPLVFFHFHGVRKVLGKLYDSGLQDYEVPLSAQIRRNIYRPYLARLAEGEVLVSRIRKRMSDSAASSIPFSLTDSLRKYKRAAKLVASGTCVIGP